MKWERNENEMGTKWKRNGNEMGKKWKRNEAYIKFLLDKAIALNHNED